MWVKTEATSEIEVPADPIVTVGEYSRNEKRFQPVAWKLHFGWTGDTPHYQLVGPRLTTAGNVYQTGERIGMEVPVDEVPVAVRRELAAKIQDDLDMLVAQWTAKIAKVLEGL